MELSDRAPTKSGYEYENDQILNGSKEISNIGVLDFKSQNLTWPSQLLVIRILLRSQKKTSFTQALCSATFVHWLAFRSHIFTELSVRPPKIQALSGLHQ